LRCRNFERSDAEQEKGEETYRFQVSDTLTRCVPGLRAQQTFLFEDKAASNEDTANYREDDANDLGGVTKGG
jgi:hypothetical protein